MKAGSQAHRSSAISAANENRIRVRGHRMTNYETLIAPLLREDARGPLRELPEFGTELDVENSEG
jgi:hypothetical protein